MLDQVLAPYRKASSLGRLGLAVLGTFVPVLGALWFWGWTLDHLRNVAWGAGSEFPAIKPLESRLVPGLWAMLASSAWTLPTTLITAPASVFAITTSVMNSDVVSTLSSMDPVDSMAAQAQMTELMIEIMAPAMLWLIGLSMAGAAIAVPFAHAAMARYALYRTPSSAFQPREVWKAMRRGGRSTAIAALLSVASVFVYAPAMMLSFDRILRTMMPATMMVDPAQMAHAAVSFVVFYGLTILVGLLSSALNPGIMAAWGHASRTAYELDVRTTD